MEFIGYLLANTKSYVKDKYPSKLDSFYGFLKPETKEVMQGAILSNKWYDLRLFQDCLEALNKVFPDGKNLKEVGQYSANLQLKGIFGLISRLIKAEKVFAKSQESWKRVFSGGEVESKYEENRLFLRISQFHFTDFHLQVYLHYISHLIFLIKKRKIEHSYKRIDDNTTEFEFIVK